MNKRFISIISLVIIPQAIILCQDVPEQSHNSLWERFRAWSNTSTMNNTFPRDFSGQPHVGRDNNQFENHQPNEPRAENGGQPENSQTYFSTFTSWCNEHYQKTKEKISDTLTNKTIKAVFNEVDERYISKISGYIKPTAIGMGAITLILMGYGIGHYKGKKESDHLLNNASPNPYLRKYDNLGH